MQDGRVPKLQLYNRTLESTGKPRYLWRWGGHRMRVYVAQSQNLEILYGKFEDNDSNAQRITSCCR